MLCGYHIMVQLIHINSFKTTVLYLIDVKMKYCDNVFRGIHTY